MYLLCRQTFKLIQFYKTWPSYDLSSKEVVWSVIALSIYEKKLNIKSTNCIKFNLDNSKSNFSCSSFIGQVDKAPKIDKYK